MSTLKIYTDGGARGNPGPSAIGVVIKNEADKIVYQRGEKIGWATNNEAEYQALIFALEWINKNEQTVERIDFFLDSKLVVSQMRGEFKVKSPKVKPLWQKAKILEEKFPSMIIYNLIPRELNSAADSLLNQALDLIQ